MTETVFNKVDYTVGELIEAVELGSIELPGVQRPFMWKNDKICNLFASMYRGAPAGGMIFWGNACTGDVKTISHNGQRETPKLQVVDGQQRLTSLYAVLKGTPVVRRNDEEELIEIAFNPLLEKFEVADETIRNDKAYIPNISVLWNDGADPLTIVESYIESLESAEDVSTEERKQIGQAVARLQSLTDFPFTAHELSAVVI
jgi:uncharacterized protein with ParB-like and HNH nuclease domain